MIDTERTSFLIIHADGLAYRSSVKI